VIYQCYFRLEHRERLFGQRPYVGFGLEPETNPEIARRCPELAEPEVRKHLCEYAAMLHIWRNKSYLAEKWIGFTSYAQAEKTPFRFTSSRDVEDALESAQLVGWGWHEVGHYRSGELSGAAAQFEFSHPGGFAYLARALAEFEIRLPQRFHADRWVLFGSYWVLPARLFEDFMAFSWPVVDWCLRTRKEFAYVESNPRSIGFVVERLFNVWYMQRGLSTLRLGPVPGRRRLKAIDSQGRLEGDRKLDKIFPPMDILSFMLVAQGMKALDVSAGDGYMAHLLALVAGARGTVWAQNPEPDARLAEREQSGTDTNLIPVVRPFEDPLPDDVQALDLITMVRTYRRILCSGTDRAVMNRRLLTALKPGGRLVVIDDVASEGCSGGNGGMLQPISEADVKADFLEAGFLLDAESDFLRKSQESGKHVSTAMRDTPERFVLRFIRPYPEEV
jgi:predicted methyltransferase